MARGAAVRTGPGQRRGSSRMPSEPAAAALDDQSGPDSVVAMLSAALGLMTFVTGVWAFVAPGSFFDVIAPFEPYNRHFIHDAGAFSIGVSCALLLTAARRTGAIVGLGGYTASAVLHLVSHLLDRDLGGNPARDFPYLTFLAVAGIAGLAASLRRRAVADRLRA